MADRQDVTFTVQLESKYPPKGGGYSYKCDIEGTECYLDTVEVLQLGQTYVAHSIAKLERKGVKKVLYGKASGIAPAGGAAAPQNRTGTGQARQAPSLPIMAELRAVGTIIKTIRFEGTSKDNEGHVPEDEKMESTTLNTALMEVFRRGAIERMAEYQSKSLDDEEGAGGGASSSGPDDELPPDDNIPF